jgi:hypothetical protein
VGHYCQIDHLSILFHIMSFRVLWVFLRSRPALPTSIPFKKFRSANGTPPPDRLSETPGDSQTNRIKIHYLKHVFQIMSVLFIIMSLALGHGLAIPLPRRWTRDHSIEIGAISSFRFLTEGESLAKSSL